jgi:hypothetical protein
MRPVTSSRARTGSPTALGGRLPPSVKVAPLSVERAKPVNRFVPPALEPESLKPTNIVLPNATRLLSLWVNRPVAVLPLLLVREFAGSGGFSTGPP